MVKYIIYAEDDDNPGSQIVVKKIKNSEFEALGFISDMKNLSIYGCMTVVKQTDDKGEFVWIPQDLRWEPIRKQEDAQ